MDRERNQVSGLLGVGLAVTLLISASSSQAQEGPADLARRQQQQEAVRGDTDRLVRRTSTMLRVLDYYQLDCGAEKRLLDEIGTALAGLSKVEMAEVIARLEAAAQARSANAARQQTEGAQVRHREILAKLRDLLLRYEAVKDLNQAALRLETLAQDQLRQHLQNQQLLKSLQRAPEQSADRTAPTRPNVLKAMRRAVDDQQDREREVTEMLQQLGKSREQLSADQQERLKMGEALAQARRINENLWYLSRELNKATQEGFDEGQWRAGVERQRRSTTDLQDLAAAFRAMPDRAGALREARESLDRALRDQDDLRLQAQRLQDPRVQDQERIREPQGRPREADQLGDQQVQVQYATRRIQNLLQTHASSLADKLGTARQAMDESERLLRENQSRPASQAQARASALLEQVRSEVDRALAEAEKPSTDPLTALEQAAHQLNQLLGEQRDTQAKTREAAAAQRPERLAPLAAKQDQLAQAADELNQRPLPTRPQTQQALDRAARAMAEAAQALQDRQGTPAVNKQAEAIAALNQAKQQLDAQIQATAQRRQEIAALQQADKQLESLGQQQGRVAGQAKDLASKPDAAATKQLAQQQAALTAPTEAVAKQLQSTAPMAAQSAASSAEHMKAAERQLSQQQAKNGAQEADAAAQQLANARRAVAQALDQRQNQEIADRAALQPGTTNPATAARQVAKALAQTREAARHSQAAATRLGATSPAAAAPDLTHLQNQLAERAKALGLGEAVQPASEAAGRLQQGDLTASIAAQKQALARLQQGKTPEGAAAKDQPAPLEPAKADNASALAQMQQRLLAATQALAQSQEATEAAEAALTQAQALAPPEIQPRLSHANLDLNQADEHLQAAAPLEANQAQQLAANQLTKALQTLQSVTTAMGPSAQRRGQRPSPRGQSEKAQARGSQPNSKQGEPAPPSAEPLNPSGGDGDRVADGKLKNAPSQLRDVKGDGSFIQLPARQREMIRQALSEHLPPQYAALIQQYYVNIARGKPAAKPAPEAPH